MERETGSEDAEGIGFIRSLTPLWLHLESRGYEPRVLVDYRPWLVVFYSPQNSQPESWLVCTSSACPSNVYEMGTQPLPDTLTMESCGAVDGNDYLVFQDVSTFRSLEVALEWADTFSATPGTGQMCGPHSIGAPHV